MGRHTPSASRNGEKSMFLVTKSRVSARRSIRKSSTHCRAHDQTYWPSHQIGNDHHFYLPSSIALMYFWVLRCLGVLGLQHCNVFEGFRRNILRYLIVEANFKRKNLHCHIYRISMRCCERACSA